MSSEAKEELRSLGVRPNKELGQNFLIDSSVISQIVDFGCPLASEQLVEIGPGLGALTSELAAVGDLTVIEIEKAFAKQLESDYPAITVLNEDVRFIDFSELGKNLVVFGNLPYCFSSEITLHLLEFSDSINRVVMMLQKEFAERIAAKPGTKKFGTLTILAQLKADAMLGPVIKGESFYPSPDVDSQLVELRFYDKPKYKLEDDFLLKQMIRTVFKERRKKISNTIKKMEGIIVDWVEVFELAKVNPDARPEHLEVAEFVELANALSKLRR